MQFVHTIVGTLGGLLVWGQGLLVWGQGLLAWGQGRVGETFPLKATDT